MNYLQEQILQLLSKLIELSALCCQIVLIQEHGDGTQKFAKPARKFSNLCLLPFAHRTIVQQWVVVNRHLTKQQYPSVTP